MKINRLELVQALEAVSPGLAKSEAVEQSSCFIFRDGVVETYNDEVACRFPVPSIEFSGAVQAAPLLALLTKLEEDQVDVEATGAELVVRGKRKRAGVKMESKIMSPIDAVETPEDWMAVSEDFAEAVALVQTCAMGSAKDSFVVVCVRIHPKYIEATDEFQAARYRIDTGIDQPTLVRRESIKHVVATGMDSLSLSRNWLHFRNPAKLQMSCRRYIEAYPDLTPILKEAGEPITLPGGIAEAVEKAEIFTEGGGILTVSLSENQMVITGEGAAGYYTEKKIVTYAGPQIAFTMSPKMLAEVNNKATECQVVAGAGGLPGRLRIHGGKWVYVSCLGVAKE